MPYQVTWSKRNTSYWGETTVETKEEVIDYLQKQGYAQHIIDEVMRDDGYFSEFDVINVKEVPHQKPAYIVCDPNGILLVRQLLRKGTDLRPLLKCRNKEIANMVIEGTARKLGKTKRRLPTAHQESLVTAIPYWLTQVESFTCMNLELGDVRVYKEKDYSPT